MGSNCERFEHGNRISKIRKTGVISSLAEKLSASQEDFVPQRKLNLLTTVLDFIVDSHNNKQKKKPNMWEIYSNLLKVRRKNSTAKSNVLDEF